MSEDPIMTLLKLFASFMGVAAAIGRFGAPELRAWVHAHPELLDPRLDQPLRAWLQNVRDAEDSGAAAALGACVQLRRECRDYGTDAAFDSQAWEDSQTDAAATLLRLRSEALRAETTYDHTQSVQALQQMVEVWRQCEDQAAAVDAPWLIRADFAIGLSVARLGRYRVTHDRADSDHAVATLSRIAEQLPRTSGMRLTCLINAAIGWRNRSSFEQSKACLDKAIDIYQQVVTDRADTGRTDDQAVTAVGDTCRCLWLRYQMTGDVSDLRRTEQVRQAWLALGPPVRPQDAAWQAELAARLAEHGTGP
jgi:hypothetical protein